MTHETPEPLRPEPPQKPVPPLPPDFTLSGAAPAKVVRIKDLNVIDFMADRLERLEKELALERERASGAQNLLQRQETLRTEVETHMKAIHEQLRREKAERENSEDKSHAQGRIEALELRLDEMHKTWANLLKDTLAKRDESSALRAGEASLELAPLLRDRLDDIQRGLALDRERQNGLMNALVREKAEFAEILQEKSDALRQEWHRERLRQEKELSDQSSRQAEELKSGLDRITDLLTATPASKDEALAAAELEKRSLLASLEERRNALAHAAEERGRAEASWENRLKEALREISEERDKNQALQRRILELEGDSAAWKDRLEAADRHIKFTEGRLIQAGAERDGVAKHLIEEAEKVRAQIEARKKSESEWSVEITNLQKESRVLSHERLRDTAALAEMRAQISVLTEQLTKILREKEELSARYAAWEEERRQLQEALQKKDEISSLLTATFQKMLKTP